MGCGKWLIMLTIKKLKRFRWNGNVRGGRMKRMIKTALCFLAAACMVFPGSNSLAAKAKPLSGQDENGNTWVYDRETKTLTFSGTTDLEEFELDGHSPEPRWWCWNNEAEHLVIENGITGLPGEEFSDFYKLKTVELPDTVTYIGNCVFDGCVEIETIKMSENITFIGDLAFSDCYSWKNVWIPEKVTSIGEWAFCRCMSIKEIKIPDTVTKIGAFAFDGCANLKYVQLPKRIEIIEEGIFRDCKNLSRVEMPDSVKKLKTGIFSGAGITRIEIPKNVTSFYKGKDRYTNNGIFQDCKKLKVITIKSKNLNHIYKGAFSGLNKNTEIKVPKSCLKKYKKLFRKAGLDKKIKVKAISGKKKFSPMRFPEKKYKADHLGPPCTYTAFTSIILIISPASA